MELDKPKRFYLDTPEGFIKNICSQVVSKTTNAGNIYFTINDVVYFMYHRYTNTLNFDFYKICKMLQSRFGIRYIDLIELVRHHLNVDIRNVTVRSIILKEQIPHDEI